MCELRAQEAIPALRGLCVCNGDEEKQERGCLVPPLGIFALPRPCQSQNRLIIHSCLFAERTRAQSVLNSYPKGLIPRCLHRCAQGLGRCPPALEACTELGLQEDQTSELCVLLELLFQPGSAPGLCLGLPVPSQPHLSFSAWKSISPVLPHPMGPGCAGREFRDRCGTCWHWVLGFPLVCQDFVFLLFFWKTRLASNLAAASVCDRLHSQHCLPCAGSCSLPWMYPVDPFGILFWHHSCSHIVPP